MHKRLRDGQAVVDAAQHRRRRDAGFLQFHRRMVGGHIERPLIAGNADTGCVPGDEESSNALRRARLPRCPCKDEQMCAVVRARLPLLATGDFEAVAVAVADARSDSRQKRRVAAVIGLGESEGGAKLAAQTLGDEGAALLVRAEMMDHEHVGEIADDAVFVLQVVGETQAASVDGV